MQQCHEQHERNALVIKLFAVGFCAYGWINQLPLELLGFGALLLWVQEAIFKTYQGRLVERLLVVEALLRDDTPPASASMQLHSAWESTRPGGLGLLSSYARNAGRPTVAFPYLPMLLALILAACY